MEESQLSNKRIAKNTMFLYIRMLLIMGVSLYTVRVTLNLLGETDYGIYNVVGGIVLLFSFLSSSLSSSSQRFFAVELAKKNEESLNKLFSMSITIFISFSIICVIIAETIGLWFLNNKMTIPVSRMFAANLTYQFSIVTFLMEIVVIPHRALIIAHEKMNSFAYLGMIEAFLKLLVVVLLSLFATYDRLNTYAILMLISSIIVFLCYYFYCKKHFKESAYHLFWSSPLAKDVLSFSGWHFLGSSSSSICNYGVNILLNIFFNPAVNAARAISLQVNGAIMQLSSNFFNAVQPQMYKSYSLGEIKALHKLINRSSIMSAFLLSIIIVPMIINAQYILSLWLVKIPDHTVLFTQIILAANITSAFTGPIMIPALATGKIRNFEIITSLVYLLNIPVIYVAFKLNAQPECSVLIGFIISVINILIQCYLLISLIKFNFFDYIFLLLKIALVTVGIWLILFYSPFFGTKFFHLFWTSAISSIMHVIIYFYIIIDAKDRSILKNYVYTKIFK